MSRQAQEQDQMAHPISLAARTERKSRFSRQTLGETGTALVVFAASFVLGTAYLNQPEIQFRPDADTGGQMLLPCVLFATGHGLRTSGGLPPSALEFVSQKRPSLDPGVIPPDINTGPNMGKFFYDRHYLLYTIGWTWRILGLSWWSIRILMSAVFGVVAVLMYGVFRLGMPRLMAVLMLAPSAFSPVLLAQLPWLRSFFKVPFMLAGLLVIGYLVSRRQRLRTLLLLAPLLGFIIGFGLGFRQDPGICLPAAAAAILIGVRGKERIRLHHRLVAVSLLALGFLIPAWPTLRMTHETGGNNSFYMMQGMAPHALQDLDVARPSYTPIYSFLDFVTHAYVGHYYNLQHAPNIDGRAFPYLCLLMGCTDRNQVLLNGPASAPLNIWTPEAERCARQIVRRLYWTFPADVMARGYGATLRILRGLEKKAVFGNPNAPVEKAARAFTQPLAEHLDRFGPLYAAAAGMLLAALDLRLAISALLILLYFTGYTGLQFHVRHAFQWNFLSYWPIGFLLGAVWFLVKQAFASLRGRSPNSRGFSVGWGLARAVAFVAMAAVGLGGPLCLARAWQHHAIKELLHQYETAQLEPVPFHEVAETNGDTTYCPERFPGLERPYSRGLWAVLRRWGVAIPDGADVTSEYLVMDLNSRIQNPNVSVSYNQAAGFDYGERLFLAKETGGAFRMFVPVFDFSSSFQRRHPWAPYAQVRGIRESPDTKLEGLYRVRNIQDFPLLVSICIPADMDAFKWHCRLKLLRDLPAI